MARINDLLRQLDNVDPELAKELKTEVKALSDRREFGLNFERHTPEQVELPGRPVRRGDKVHILPPRGETPKAENKVMWLVTSIDKTETPFVAHLSKLRGPEETREVSIEDLVVVAEFRDPIYPGLVSTGKVERGGDKPFHTVINAENFHALEALMFTHRGKVDCIYIDPPYNTGARDWKYNNDYVESEDLYRHSKWLAFMERRLLLAKELLNPENSVLVVAIDEKEYLRLGLLLGQIFGEANVQMVADSINPRAGVARPNAFTRVDEYLFFVTLGAAAIESHLLSGDIAPEKVTAPIWFSLMRTGTNSARTDSPNLFYPVWVTPEGLLHSVGSGIPLNQDRSSVPPPAPGLNAIWPLRPDGSENTWQLGAPTLRKAFDEGTARVNVGANKVTINYLRNAEKQRILAGEIEQIGRDSNGALILRHAEGAQRITRPKTIWLSPAHDAGLYGTQLLRSLIPGRKFPFPKSLYSVEDTLRFVVGSKPNALVIDFFAGSGTTAHAVMRLNRQDGGRRQSISITNNEVSDDEQTALIKRGLRPGDEDWDSLGICDFITKPRIRSAITGITPDGSKVAGTYKFQDPFPMELGFEENVEFFTLSYETALEIEAGRSFERISALLWLKAGAQGKRLSEIGEHGWALTSSYGILADLDNAETFLDQLREEPGVKVVFIFTSEDRLFESFARDLPGYVEAIRMNESYFRNSEIEALAVTR